MRNHATSRACAALLIAFSVTIAAPASAQLGKLRKIGVDAIKDAAAGKKPAAAKDPTAPRVDYAITADRLAAIVTVLTPAAEEAKREADARAVTKSYDARMKLAQDCMSKAEKGTPDMAGMQSPAYEKIANRLVALTPRVEKSLAAKRHREYLATIDTVLVLQLQMAGLLFNANCPALPYKPAAMIDQMAAKMDQKDAEGQDDDNGITVPEASRAGMTTGQFGRIRERLAAWLLIQSGDLPPTGEQFTDEETAVLTARLADIKKFGPLFKAGVMRWVSWDDIKSW